MSLPTLFILHLNKLPYILNNSTVSMYADDSSLCFWTKLWTKASKVCSLDYEKISFEPTLKAYQLLNLRLILLLSYFIFYYFVKIYPNTESVAVLGTARPGAEIICVALVWKFFVNQDYSSSFFAKIFMPQGCIQMFSCDFFSIFSEVRGSFCVTKSVGPGAVAPLAPLKTATALNIGLFFNQLSVSCPNTCLLFYCLEVYVL